MQNRHLRSKNKIPKKKDKLDSTSDLDLLCARNPLKKHQIFKKQDDFKNLPSCKASSLCKIVTLGQQNSNFIKHVKIYSTSDLELFCAKNRLKKKKHQIIKKQDDFKNLPSCKAYSLCKIVTFGQKLKLQKTCQNLVQTVNFFAF